jgi:hypothetical protein
VCSTVVDAREDLIGRPYLEFINSQNNSNLLKLGSNRN